MSEGRRRGEKKREEERREKTVETIRTDVRRCVAQSNQSSLLKRRVLQTRTGGNEGEKWTNEGMAGNVQDTL